MAKKFYGEKGLRGLFFAFVCMFVMGIIACDNEKEYGEYLVDVQSSTVKKDQPSDTVVPKDPDLEFFITPVHEADSNVVVIADTVGERTTKSYWVSNGKAKLSLKEYKYDTEMKYKNLNVEYSNQGKVMGDPEAKEINGYVKYVTRCSFPWEDGNVGYVDAESWQVIEKVNGETHTFPYAKLSSFEVLSLNNVEKTGTRGQYVADSCYTEAKIKLHYIYEGTDVSAFDVILVDTCFRRFRANDDVEEWSHDKETRKVTTKTTEDVSFRKVGKNLSGTYTYLDKSHTLQYCVKPIDDRELQVKSFAFAFESTNGVRYGETKLDRIEGDWKIYRREFVYTSVFVTPMGDKIETKYYGFTEGTTYDDGNVKVEFPVLDINLSEGQTTVSDLQGDDWYDRANFKNTINADYQGYAQSVSENVVLLKEKARETFRGWDESTKRKEITLWNVKITEDYVIRDSEGNEDRKTYEFNLGWKFEPTSYWSIHANDATYFTGDVIASVNGTKKTVKSKDGLATLTYIENTHDFVANVTVPTGIQQDTWVAITINDCSLEREGNVSDFGHDDYTMQDGGAKLSEAISSDSEDLYPYKHNLTFGFGGVEATKATEGEIHVAKAPDIPTFFGKLKSMSFIVVNNPDHTDYMYSALAHLEDGYVVPGTWNKSGEIEWHLEWQQKASADNLNGCVYEHSSGKWVPVRGWDSPDCLQYDTESGANADNQLYNTANDWNWDEGHKVNGHASVTTDRFSYTMKDGVVSVKDARHGNSLGSWTYKQ